MDNRAKRYPADVRAAAVALFRQVGDARIVARQLGCDEESVRIWAYLADHPKTTYKAAQKVVRRVTREAIAACCAPTQAANDNKPCADPPHVSLDGSLELHWTADGLVNLNDIYEAAKARGMADGKLGPWEWARAPRAKTSGTSGKVSTSGGPGWELVATLASTLNTDADRVLRSRAGRGGGVFSHEQVALAFAMYLSPRLHLEVTKLFFRVKAKDMSLAGEIAEGANENHRIAMAARIADEASPQDRAWLIKRAQGTAVRNEFTAKLAEHGVKDEGYARITNIINVHILGAPSRELKAQWGLAKGASLRDHLSLEKLVDLMFTEQHTGRKIQAANAQGNKECAEETEKAVKAVAGLLN